MAPTLADPPVENEPSAVAPRPGPTPPDQTPASQTPVTANNPGAPARPPVPTSSAPQEPGSTGPPTPAGPAVSTTPVAANNDRAEGLATVRAVGLPSVARREGQPVEVELAPQCAGAEKAKVERTGIEVADLDPDPRIFTFDTRELGLGTHLVQVACPRDLTSRTKVLVYRQNGAERGEANSIVLAGGLGLASTAAVVGLPGSIVRRRDE